MLNQCNFIGNLGTDPEIRSMNSGDKVASFRIACTEKWRDKASGEAREKTEWVSVSVFGPLTKVVENYLKKGSKVFVSGKMQTRKWQDQSGNDRYSTEIVLQGFNSVLTMLDSRSEGGGGGQSQGGYSQGGAPAGGMDDEIPFAPEWRS